ncbi:hypothetical protein EFE23_27745, partial [Micromonospora solifontis]
MSPPAPGRRVTSRRAPPRKAASHGPRPPPRHTAVPLPSPFAGAGRRGNRGGRRHARGGDHRQRRYHPRLGRRREG